MSFQKKKTYRSKKYMDFVKILECCVSSPCFEVIERHPHHTETGGIGMKGSDLSCIPLCGFHHDEIHRGGKETFQYKYAIDIKDKVVEANHAYIQYLEGK